ncbi:MAG: recombinase, partial [Bdellovibrionales bacterium]
MNQKNLANNILSDITVHMKYAKYSPELERRETWEELVERNRKMHIKKYRGMGIAKEINKAYEFVQKKKVLPSMRSLQFGGRSIELTPSRIYNCAYLPIDDWRAFGETMFLLLGGTGVGYSVQKHHVEKLPEIRRPNQRSRRFLIGDSIEGWADAIKALCKNYFQGGDSLVFDYGDIRPKGARLVTSGGKAPGPGPLREAIVKIKGILESKEDGEKLKSIEVHDIVCHIADAVLAGGIRRAALISLFSATDMDMVTCKSGDWWETNPQRGRANNSAVLLRHRITEEFFMDLWKRVEASGAGEPGIYLSNDRDWGTNPCCEIALRPFQFCNLCEVNVSDVKDQADLDARVRAAAFIGTLQAGYTDFHYLRPIWQRTTERDALIGVSMTGIASGAVLELDMT